MSSESTSDQTKEKDINMIVQLGDAVATQPPSTAAVEDDDSSGNRKAKRRAEREKEDEAVRKMIDPEGKLSKKELRKALGEYYMSKLNPEQLQAKLKNPKYAQSAMKLLEEKGVDTSSLDVATPLTASKEPKEPHIHEVDLPDSDYYFLGSHRLVWPYHSVHRARTKQRWQGRTVADVMSDEFVAFHEGYLEHAVKHQKIHVNGVPVNADYVFENGDLLEHFVHKHEPPVRADPVTVVHRRPDLNVLVIDKPASIPVHPCGKFLLNSVTHIVAKETGIRTLHVVHRLDRATSGLLMLATDSQAAERISSQLRARTLRKHYLARVRGRFPSTMEEARQSAAAAAQTGILGGGNGRSGTDQRFIERSELSGKDIDMEDEAEESTSASSIPANDSSSKNTVANSGTEESATDSEASSVGLIPPLLGSWGETWGVNEAVVMWDGVGARTLRNAAQNMLLADTDDVAISATSGNSEDSENGNSGEDVMSMPCEIVVDRPVAKTDLRYGLFGIGPAERHSNAKYNQSNYGPEGKAALTCFRRISYDPVTDTSLVHCMPRTGRTHQLRVHLMHLGHPIANDERYGGMRLPEWSVVKRECALAAGKSLDSENSVVDIPNDANEERRAVLWRQARDSTCVFCADVNAGLWSDRFHFLKPESADSENTPISEEMKKSETSEPGIEDGRLELSGSITSGAHGSSSQGLVGVKFSERCCNSGNASQHQDWVDGLPMRDGKIAMDVYPDNVDIDPEREVIWLHALKYEAPDWTFSVPAPVWAEDRTLTVPNMYYPPV